MPPQFQFVDILRVWATHAVRVRCVECVGHSEHRQYNTCARTDPAVHIRTNARTYVCTTGARQHVGIHIRTYVHVQIYRGVGRCFEVEGGGGKQ